jgi:hypothetical protein
MRLAAADTWIELRIVGYQFPGNATGEYDSNWLIVEGAIRHPRGGWQFRDPSLLTYEVARLADWLEAVAAGNESRPWCGFIEPNLSFDVTGEGASRVLRLSFGCEALPPWAVSGEEVAVEFPVTGLDLVGAVASLRGQLEKFPQRAER